MILFREHRGSLDESMKTVIEIEPTKEALRALVVERFKQLGIVWLIRDRDQVRVDRQGFDERTGWDTHIVTVDNWGPVGFTSGPVL
jgi:hypothetical protein